MKLNTELPITVSYFPIKNLNENENEEKNETINEEKNEEKSEGIVSVIETITLKDINDKITSENDQSKIILDTNKDFEIVYKSLQKWDDINADKNWLLLTGSFKLKEKVKNYIYVYRDVCVYVYINSFKIIGFY